MSLSSVVPNGRFIALVTEVASFCQTRVWGFLQQHKIIPLYSIYQKGGGKKANTGISELVVHYALVLCPVSSVATYNSVAGARVPAGGGPGAFCSCWSADQFVFFNMTIVAAKPDNEKLKVK